MYLIKTCHACKTKLRFPIDKGTIRVKCSCGHSFIANPDSADIYQDASFDLSRTRCGLKKMNPLKNALSALSVKGFMSGIISKLLHLKYKIQNFRLLPYHEKRKIIIAIAILFTSITGLAVTIFLLATRCNQDRIIV